MFTICSVSLPSMASYSYAICPGFTPACCAMRNSSSFNAEDAVRRSTTYSARNRSPSRRAASTLSTSFRVIATRACAAASWSPKSPARRRRSSAEPPNGWNASTAAARFAATSTPINARIATRGCLSLAHSKFLVIGHRDAAAVLRFGLRGRQRAVLVDVAEDRRRFEGLQQILYPFRLVRRNSHIQRHLVARIDSRMQRGDADIVGRGLFQVGEHAAPTDRLVIDQIVDEDAAFEHGRVLRLAQHGVQPRLLGPHRAQTPFHSTHVATQVLQLRPVEQRQIRQQRQRYQQRSRQYRRRHQHGPVAPEGLARQVDRNSHLNYFSRWIANSPATPRCSLRARPRASAPRPPPRPVLPRSAARPRPS